MLLGDALEAVRVGRRQGREDDDDERGDREARRPTSSGEQRSAICRPPRLSAGAGDGGAGRARRRAA